MPDPTGPPPLRARQRAEKPVNSASGDRFVREPECELRTGLSRSTRWRLERKGLFPRRRQLSPGCSGWLDCELSAWIASR